MPAIRDGVFRYNSETGLASWGNEKTYNEWLIVRQNFNVSKGVTNIQMAEKVNDKYFVDIKPIFGSHDPAWELIDAEGGKTLLFMNER